MASTPAKYKVVFLGDEAAGKTSIVRRYMLNTFEDGIQATIGMDFQSKTVYLKDRSLRLQLWDTAGQERFRSLISSYIRDSAAAVVVYDITSRTSFSATRTWIEAVRNDRGDQTLVTLVGNKSDLVDKREVSEEEGKEQAQELGVLFVETSAKLGQNIDELFHQLATNLPGVPGTAEGASEESSAAAGSAGIQLRADSSTEAVKKHKRCGC